ncbi:MAG: hypothetical protein Q7R81_02995 [Candidatus Peregrinibacteria bacterium]|nr:hypothetical protein [Candidatus Peregrinibacteria bacterium]
MFDLRIAITAAIIVAITSVGYGSLILLQPPPPERPAGSPLLDSFRDPPPTYSDRVVFENFGKNDEDVRNAQRRADVNTILNAVYQYSIDNGGSMPASIPFEFGDICNTNASICDAIDLSALIGPYLVAIPMDALLDGSSLISGYRIRQDDNGQITVMSAFAENDVISVTR